MKLCKLQNCVKLLKLMNFKINSNDNLSFNIKLCINYIVQKGFILTQLQKLVNCKQGLAK